MPMLSSYDPATDTYGESEVLASVSLCSDTLDSELFQGKQVDTLKQLYPKSLCLDGSSYKFKGNEATQFDGGYEFLSIFVMPCIQELLGDQGTCRSSEETWDYVKKRGVLFNFLVPQNYIDFKNFTNPVQTYAD